MACEDTEEDQMVGKKIAVIGWYGHGNIGDESFKTAFSHLWLNNTFSYFDKVPEQVNSFDACFIGGGSILDNAFFNFESIKIPLAFIGVSVGATITNPALKRAIERAKVIVVRDSSSLEYLESKARPTMLAPDIVFGYATHVQQKKVSDKTVCVLVNDFMAPKHNSELYKGDAWNWFTHEFSQCLNDLSTDGYKIKMFPMCTGAVDDRRAAASIISRMEHPDRVEWMLDEFCDDSEICLRHEINECDLVITQRFHGIVYAAKAGRRVISISAHDKIKSICYDMGLVKPVDYYGFSKSEFKYSLQEVSTVEPSKFYRYAAEAKEKWETMSAIVSAQLFS